MPYIEKDTREVLDNYPLSCEAPGELNYWFTRIIKAYVNYKGLKYQTINDVVGALEGAKLEFYRRVVVPYEEGKRESNGDVY